MNVKREDNIEMHDIHDVSLRCYFCYYGSGQQFLIGNGSSRSVTSIALDQPEQVSFS